MLTHSTDGPWTLTLSERHSQRPQGVWSHLCEMSRVGRSTERSRLVLARGWGGGVSADTRGSFRGEGKVLEVTVVALIQL